MHRTKLFRNVLFQCGGGGNVVPCPNIAGEMLSGGGGGGGVDVVDLYSLSFFLKYGNVLVFDNFQQYLDAETRL